MMGFAVRSVGGTTLNHDVAVFPTETEAELWVLDRTSQSDSGGGILKRGAGEDVS